MMQGLNWKIKQLSTPVQNTDRQSDLMSDYQAVLFLVAMDTGTPDVAPALPFCYITSCFQQRGSSLSVRNNTEIIYWDQWFKSVVR
ncbi:MAG: hypothetical protein OHK0047_37180 [Leptolyngbyaceae cyanobacterium]